MAGGALLREGFDQTLAHPLTGHLDQAQRGDLGHLVLGAIPCQALHQAAKHQVAVGRHDHIHVVDHDHAADVAQTQLAGNLLGGLQVAPGHGLLQGLAPADESTCVHIDGGHGLGTVDDQGAAGGQVDLTLHPLAELAVDAPLVEHVLALMLGRVPPHQLVPEIGGHGVQVVLDPVIDPIALDNQTGEIIVEDISHHSDGNIGFALKELGPLAVQELLALGLDLLPLALEVLQVLGQGLLTGTVGRSADDDPHVLGGDT